MLSLIHIYPLLVRSALLYIVSPHELFLIMQPDCLTDIIRIYPKRTQLDVYKRQFLGGVH